MIKWFLIYKWLELKEFVQERWIPISIIGTALVSGLMWSAILMQTNQTPFQVVYLSSLLGVVTMMALGLCFKFTMWIRSIIKDNIEKAKTAVSYDVSKLECCRCDGGRIKIIPPLRSSLRLRFKCLDCGIVDDICNADRRQK